MVEVTVEGKTTLARLVRTGAHVDPLGLHHRAAGNKAVEIGWVAGGSCRGAMA